MRAARAKDISFLVAMLGMLLRLFRLADKDDQRAAWLASEVDALRSIMAASEPRGEWCDLAVCLARSARSWSAGTSITAEKLRRVTRKEIGSRSTGWVCGVIPVAEAGNADRLTPIMCAMIVGSLVLIALSAGPAHVLFTS